MNNKSLNKRVTYSKPSGDIASESSRLADEASERFKEQARLTKALLQFPHRKSCICCGKALEGVQCEHRLLSLTECQSCGHVQTTNQPPDGYPHNVLDDISFSNAQVYPDLDSEQYFDRRDRIYKPKLDWIWQSLIDQGFSEEEICRKGWVEIGSGSGYFLSAARQKGIKSVTGLEADPKLFEISRRQNPDSENILWQQSFPAALEGFDAEIFCSFFVLEHLDDLSQVWESLAQKPRGTFFIFSVPFYGLSCLLENAFPSQFARTLEGVAHTHVFTESSVEYGLDIANCEIVAEWVFGQDMSDFMRFLRVASLSGQGEFKVHRSMKERLHTALDDLQSVVDRLNLTDQRHIMAVRR